MTSKMISGTGLQLLRRFDKKPKEVQATLLEEVGAMLSAAMAQCRVGACVGVDVNSFVRSFECHVV